MKRILPLLLIAFASAAYAGGDVLREDTATQIALGPFLDGTDGVTAETALTVTEFDCDLVKHADSGMTNTALTITASAGSNDAAHIQSGMYSLELTATDTNTAGRLTIICDHATPATFVPVRQTYMVMPTQEYDSLYGTDVQQVHVVEFTSAVITADAIATDAIGAAEIAADAVGAAEAGFLTDSTGFQGADIAAILTDTGTTIPATITTIDNELAVVDGIVDNILVDTAVIGAAGAGLTEAGGTGDHLTAIDLPNQTMDITGTLSGTVGGIAGTITTLDALDTAQDTQHGTTQTNIAALPTAAENATEHLTQQRVLVGTCDSGSTTTCVDDALTQASTSQLDDRLICFSDSWCALITDFTPGTDTVTTTKVAPSTRSTLGYTIFPATAQ